MKATTRSLGTREISPRNKHVKDSGPSHAKKERKKLEKRRGQICRWRRRRERRRRDFEIRERKRKLEGTYQRGNPQGGVGGGGEERELEKGKKQLTILHGESGECTFGTLSGKIHNLPFQKWTFYPRSKEKQRHSAMDSTIEESQEKEKGRSATEREEEERLLSRHSSTGCASRERGLSG